ncbi:MAG: hypothetical protein BWX80_03168 [Candidatus Hydrogenedentes bacterium ADurb.Bin101]|nr:MAG: hypothetical protein BWX80_03168 [Candidatus Hydrogenedentes bacterium ADurb.Bin101]
MVRPSVVSTASCNSVRPILTIGAKARSFSWNASCRPTICSSRRRSRRIAASFNAVGYVSFVDWCRLISSSGETRSYRPGAAPSSCSARFVITSLTFMFVLVPAPPCSASTTICPLSSPAATSSQARRMASALAGVSAQAPSSRLVSAQAALTVPYAAIRPGCTGRPATGKFCRARRA